MNKIAKLVVLETTYEVSRSEGINKCPNGEFVCFQIYFFILGLFKDEHKNIKNSPTNLTNAYQSSVHWKGR